MEHSLPNLARTIAKIANSKTVSFGQLVRIAKLYPAKDFQGADLTGVDLGYLDLTRYDFARAVLRGADLSNTRNFSFAKFVDADLTDARLPIAAAAKFKVSPTTAQQLAYADASAFWRDRLHPLLHNRELYVSLEKELKARAEVASQVIADNMEATNVGNPESPIVRAAIRDLKVLRRLEQVATPFMPILVFVPLVEARQSSKMIRPIQFLSPTKRNAESINEYGIRLGLLRKNVRLHQRKRDFGNKNAAVDPPDGGIIEAPLGISPLQSLRGRIASLTTAPKSIESVEGYIRMYVATLFDLTDMLPIGLPSPVHIVGFLRRTS